VKVKGSVVSRVTKVSVQSVTSSSEGSSTFQECEKWIFLPKIVRFPGKNNY
jgi:hypothetical protein